jgi:hypothetical protein
MGDFLLAWLLVPIVLTAASLGCGLLIAHFAERTGGASRAEPFPGLLIAPVGFAAVVVEQLRSGARLGVITDLYVEPEAREVGVGEVLADVRDDREWTPDALDAALAEELARPKTIDDYFGEEGLATATAAPGSASTGF